MTHTTNKLLLELKKDIPDFGFIYNPETIKSFKETLGDLLLKEREVFFKKLETKDSEVSFEIFDDDSELSYLFGLLHHFHSVNGNDETREIIADFEPKYLDFSNEIQYSKRYYDMLKICLLKPELSEEQNKIITDCIKSYEVKGINLSNSKQEHLKTINKTISDLSRKFSENELDSENLFSFHSEKETDFSELPIEILDIARKNAVKVKKEGLVFGPSPAEYIAVMKYCSNGEIRKYFYDEKNKVASSGKYDNRPIVLQLLQLKEKKAQILGFKNYAELSLYFKMAESVGEVEKVLHEISVRAEKKATQEINELTKYFSLTHVNAEDIGYYSRKYKEEKYNINDKELKKYLEFSKCLEGMFAVVEKLYGTKVQLRNDILKDVEGTFLEDVNFYEITKNDTLIAYLLIDPFFRENKRGGAWKNTLRDKTNSKVPIVVNVYNIQKQDTEILIDFRELETIFHEFGHAIHEMFSESKYSDLSGSNVEWDFIEVPSQFHEHFCHEKESLDMFAHHHKTGENIPEEMLNSMKNAENFGNGNMYLTQCQFCSIDMMLHTSSVPKTIDELDDMILKKVNQLSVIKKDENYKMYTSFSHIFDGAYAGGYYSYVRSEIIELDIWKEFQKQGIFNPDVSQKFYNTILSQGSRKDAKILFHDFCGRNIDLDGFFSSKGM